MADTIRTITTQAVSIAVNCYLVQSNDAYFLVDTGLARKQSDLVQDLEAAGVRPGNLKRIFLTHGDLDHSGNSAFLRERYGASIAMHRGDLLNVQTGDMFTNKNTGLVAKTIMNLFFGITGMSKFTTFTPDLYLEDGQNLLNQGWDATILHLPGHSKGSICILSSNGNLFCGDLLENTKKPAVNTLGDELNQLKANAEKLKNLPIQMVYPGHGKPFQFKELLAEENKGKEK